MIGVLDYGSGNLFSITNALDKNNLPNKIVSKVEEFKEVDAIILPGVGSYKVCIQKLKKKDFFNQLKDFANSGGKLVGICLGMQMLLDSSEEEGHTEGLGLIKGKVVYLKNEKKNKELSLSIPNMGWSKIYVKDREINEGLFGKINNLEFYFANSLICKISEEQNEVAYSKFGNINFCSIFQKDNIIGIQFHPEKSGVIGLKLLKDILSNA